MFNSFDGNQSAEGLALLQNFQSMTTPGGPDASIVEFSVIEEKDETIYSLEAQIQLFEQKRNHMQEEIDSLNSEKTRLEQGNKKWISKLETEIEKNSQC